MEELYAHFCASSGICTDTRNIKEGNLFFALKGPNFNGNAYAAKAIQEGAALSIIDEPEFKADERYILVDDVLTTLQNLAKHHRSLLNIPIIAITGSNGKTTTKELLHAALSVKFKTFATSGNLNNHIGVPLSLLSINESHEIAIIEMGANHIGEIAAYCVWAKPTHGLITNIGSAHLEGFGSIAGILKGKTELYESIRKHNGTIFIDGASAKLMSKAQNISQKISYGFGTQFNYNYSLQQESPNIIIRKDDIIFRSLLFGKYNATNIIAAITVANYFKVSFEAISDGISAYQPENNRSQIVKKATNTFILDAYNANPTSMEAALESFTAMTGKEKIAILGDMFELGSEENALHQKIKDIALSKNFTKTVFVGLRFKKLEDTNALYFSNTTDAKDWFNKQNLNNTNILLKGSRSMKLETILI